MISKQASQFNNVIKHTVKPLLSLGYLSPNLMRCVYWLGQYAAVLFPIPSFVRIMPINNSHTKGEWIDIQGKIPQHKVVYYLHGGGYFFGSPETHRNLTWRIAKYADVNVFSLRYRMAPKYDIPTSVTDAIEGYKWLLLQGYRGEDIIIGGDSAGGGLTLLTMQEIKKQRLPIPSAAFCLSPFADMSSAGVSMVDNANLDPMFHQKAVRKIAQFHARHYENPKHPEISPAYSAYDDHPPLMIQVGSTEILLADAECVAKKAEHAGVDVELCKWDNMPHVFSLFAGLFPEGTQGVREITGFIKRQFSRASATEIDDAA